MAQRKSLLIAVALTSFILVILIAVTIQITPPTPATATSVPIADTTTQPSSALDPAIQAQINQREATYQQQLAAATLRLQQANAQLTQAYSKEQALADQLAAAQQALAAQQNTNVAQATSAQYAVSVAQATQTALIAAPGSTLVDSPTLASYKGNAAYKVVLDRGTIYIDANSGAVLYDGTTAATSGDN